MAEYNTYMDIEIDVQDYLDCCSEDEIREIIDILRDDGWLKSTEIYGGYDSEEWGLIHETRKSLLMLSEHAHKFTDAEETYLKQMYKKYL